MICVKCMHNKVGNLDHDKPYSAELFVYCRKCREDNRPEYIPDRQYAKYWIEFSEKYRKENK